MMTRRNRMKIFAHVGKNQQGRGLSYLVESPLNSEAIVRSQKQCIATEHPLSSLHRSSATFLDMGDKLMSWVSVGHLATTFLVPQYRPYELQCTINSPRISKLSSMINNFRPKSALRRTAKNRSHPIQWKSMSQQTSQTS